MDSTINIWAVILAAGVQFVAGAIWYMPLFGKMWGDIHDFNTKSKKVQQEMRQGMAPLLAIQLAMALLISYTLAVFIKLLPDLSAYAIAIYLWLGFIVSTQVGAVMFGGTESKWMLKKIGIMAGGALLNLLLATFIITSL